MPESRDEYMSSVTIGDRRRVDAPIHLADSDPDWPVLYEREATLLLAIGRRIWRRGRDSNPRSRLPHLAV